MFKGKLNQVQTLANQNIKTRYLLAGRDKPEPDQVCS